MQFVNRQNKYPVGSWRALIHPVADALFASEPACRRWISESVQPYVSISFVGPVVMRRENRLARQIDRITDVLSFPMLEMTDGAPDRPLTDADVDDPGAKQRQLFLGDILICIDQASRQAIEYGHSMEREMAFLALHGMLHLLGYDHDTTVRENKMNQRQKELLDHLEPGREAKESHQKL